MKVSIVIGCDNAAFDNDHAHQAPETVRILRALADKLETRGLVGGELHRLHDADGHIVGTCDVDAEE